MTIQIEEGKFYRNAKGRRVGPMRRVRGGKGLYEWTDHVGTWSSSGEHCTEPECALRLVEEWDDAALPEQPASIPELMQDLAATEGVKLDGGKPPLHLIAPDFLYAVADILDFGAKKYAPRNWEKGMDWSRVYRAAIGHLFDWFMRKGPDPETGKSHLWHAACCIMFLVCYELRNTGNDDRPPLTKSSA